MQRSSRDEKLELCASHIVESEGVPAFCENVSDMMTRTLNIESSSLELARVILKDVGLASLVLRIANSALYNRAGRTIMSVAHAITLLGWDTVRAMISTIRYIDHFSSGSAGLRELMLLSVLDALHGRDIAAAVRYPHPEEAYICGLFRNLGEVLVAWHYPHEYAQIVLAMHKEKIPARAACLRHLDFAWDDVGKLVAEAWNMPSKVTSCISGSPATTAPAMERSLVSIVDFAHNTTHALYRKGDPIETVHLRYVTDTGGVQRLVSVRDLTRIVDNAASETRDTLLKLGIPKDRLLLEQQAEHAQQILESMPAFSPSGLAALNQAIETARSGLARDEFELTALIAALLDAVCAAGFDSAVLGLLNDTHTTVRGRLASGRCADDILSRFYFPVDHAEGPIRAALVRKTDILVDRALDDRYDSSTLVTTFGPVAFGLFPIVSDGRAVGCLYADRGSASPGLNLVRSPLGRVRDVIGAAIRKKAPQSGQGRVSTPRS